MELKRVQLSLRTSIKVESLVNFIAKSTNASEIKDGHGASRAPYIDLFVDGSSNETSSGAGVVLISLKGQKLNL